MSGRSARARPDPFERDYAAPALELPAPDVREREDREGEALAVPWEPYALRGCVLTPTGWWRTAGWWWPTGR